MSGVVIRAAEGCAADANVLWDSVWDAKSGTADWAIAGASETTNLGGLRAIAILETAVTLALFTDKRIDDTHPLWYLADGDARGYFGDGVDVREDLNEGPLGSHLWLLERAPLTVRGTPIAQWAVQFALEALATLKDQGIAVRIEAQANTDEINSRLELFVQIYGHDGAQLYDRKFDLVWNQVAR